MSGAAFYLRLHLLLLESCKVLRKVFSHNAEHDSTTCVKYTTIESYIKTREPKIKSLVKRRILTNAQYDILFNSGKQVCEEDMDITLVSCLLLNILPSFPPQDKQAINDIRVIRNKLHHCKDITALDAYYFSNESRILENAIHHLSSTIDATYAAETKKAVQVVMSNPLPSPGPYLDVIKNLAMGPRGIEYLIEATDTTNSRLDSVIHVRERPNEPPVRRVKAYDPELARMQRSFNQRMKRMKESDTVSKLSSIESALRNDRSLYVVGQSSELYLDTLLIAINNLGIDHERCAEMRDCSDWKYVSREDVDLVLFHYSLRSDCLPQKSVRQALACFNTILEEFQELPLDQRMYIIITSNFEAHRLFMEESGGETHPLLSKIVEIEEPTFGTVDDPHIVNDDKMTTAIQDKYDSTLKNLKEHTQIFMDHFKTKSVPAHCLKEAKGLLRQHRILRIDGPRGSGRKSLAVKLMSSYKSDRCLLLRRPTDVQHIRLNEVSVVLIEDFQGQYDPDRQLALNWYREFDILLAMVRSGKLEVVIITETKMFNTCHLPPHDLLQHCLTLTPSIRPVVKVDPDQPSTSDPLPGSAEVSVCLNPKRMPLWGASLKEVGNPKRMPLWGASLKEVGSSIVGSYNISECVFLPTGHLVLACINSVVLMDTDLRKTLCTIDTKAVDICVASEKEVVIVDGKSPTLHVLKVEVEPPSMMHGTQINIEDAVGYRVQCQSVDASNNEIFVLCKSSVGVYEVHSLSNRGEILTRIPLRDLGLGFKSGTEYQDTKLKINRTVGKIFLASPKPDRTICISMQTGQWKDERTKNLLYRVICSDDKGTYMACTSFVKENNNNVLMVDSEGQKRTLQLNIKELSCMGYRESDGYLVIGCANKIRIYSPGYIYHTRAQITNPLNSG